jgi:hypothetical protein
MVLANLRQRMTAGDVALIIRVLARDDAARRAALEQRAATCGVDDLLDVDHLPQLLQDVQELGTPSAALFLYVTVRHTLRSVGIDDRHLSDYLGALIFEFGLRDRAFRVSRSDDEVYRYLTDLLADVGRVSGRRGFLLRAHLGNFSLWLAGLFPDFIAARRVRRGAPGLRFYEELGARGFSLASDHHLAHQLDLVDIYRAAAQRFSTLRVALNRLSDRLLFPNAHSPARLLRQVEDEFAHP